MCSLSLAQLEILIGNWPFKTTTTGECRQGYPLSGARAGEWGDIGRFQEHG